MKRKPTSYSDMLKTVAAVKHPALDFEGRLFLLSLALNASQTGENSFPGHEALVERIDRGNSAVTARYRQMVELGLISIVPSKRKGQAHCFSFNLTNDAYPETYVGRVIVGNQDETNDEELPSVERVSAIVGLEEAQPCFDRAPSLESPAAIVGNPQETNAHPKPSSLASILDLQPKTTTTTKEEICSETPLLPRKARLWLSWLWSQSSNYSAKERKAILPLRKPPKGMSESPDVTYIEGLIEQYGEAETALSWAEFCLNFPHEEGTLFPVTVFGTNFDTCRAAAISSAATYQRTKKISDSLSFARSFNGQFPDHKINTRPRLEPVASEEYFEEIPQ